MPSSRLRGFSRQSIDELADLRVHLVYDHSLIGSLFDGLWYPCHGLISINPELKGIRKKRTIIHEGLHAYENLILKVKNRFPEKQIDEWAVYHLKKDSGLASYMLEMFLIIPAKISLIDLY